MSRRFVRGAEVPRAAGHPAIGGGKRNAARVFCARHGGAGRGIACVRCGAVYSEVRTAGDVRREHFTEERGFLYAETLPHAGAPQYCGAPVLARNRLFFAPASACCRPFRAAGWRFLCCDCFCDTPCAEDVYRNGLILGGGGPATGDARGLRLLLLFRLYALWGNSGGAPVFASGIVSPLSGPRRRGGICRNR